MKRIAKPRQDSVTDQLRDLIGYANFHGMYDAADFLKAQVETADKKAGVIVERPPMGGRRVDFDPRMPYCNE